MTTTTAPATTCELAGLPLRDRHELATGCIACTAALLSTKSLSVAEMLGEFDVIDADILAGYRHVWAISADRVGVDPAWMAYPTTDRARAFASTMLALLPSGRGYC